MASHNSDLQIPMPTRNQSEFQRQNRSVLCRYPRYPRFHEDFDAPFSEAFLDTPKTPSFTNSNGYRCSIEASDARSSSAGLLTRRKSQIRAPSIIQWQDDNWVSQPKRRTSVNDKMRQWAKKSLVIVRPRSDRADVGDFDVPQRQATKNITFNASSKDGDYARSATFPRAIITVTEIPKPT